jgi:NADH-quinone oxidoreductase subunit G
MDNLLCSDGLDYAGSEAVARLRRPAGENRACRRTNNGLVPVWQHGHPGCVGAWLPAIPDLAADLKKRASVLIAAADRRAIDRGWRKRCDSAGLRGGAGTLPHRNRRRADVVFPAEAFTEREGTYTAVSAACSGFTGISPIPGVRPDFAITAQLGRKMGVDWKSVPQPGIAAIAEKQSRLAESPTPGWRKWSHRINGGQVKNCLRRHRV